MGIYVDPLSTSSPQPNVPPPSTSTEVQPLNSRGTPTVSTVHEDLYIIDPSQLIFLCIIPATPIIPRETIPHEPLRDIPMPTNKNDPGDPTPSQSLTWHQDIMMTMTPQKSWKSLPFRNL
ncbi:hypothetical protein AMTR_s00096p00119090 [Amborella trichopoda]|uniref:Uncharacterized protein n=1 Tax=Amborella trichopoda TaxID=13333 RepID=W1P499_AMBTC|nr:hypothetical protein AMTR_s00096p00119090 [Amborella trichopoda]